MGVLIVSCVHVSQIWIKSLNTEIEGLAIEAISPDLVYSWIPFKQRQSGKNHVD